MGDVARCSVGEENPTTTTTRLLLPVVPATPGDRAPGLGTLRHGGYPKPQARGQQHRLRPGASSTPTIPGGEADCPGNDDLLVTNLVDKGLVTDQLVLTVGYDIENLTDLKIGNAIMAGRLGGIVTVHL